MVFLPRFALGTRPSQGRVILLHYRNKKAADGVGNAPTSPVKAILFSRQVRPAYIRLPSKVLPAGFAPASVCLEGKCLIFSSHDSKVWSRPPVLRRAALAYDAWVIAGSTGI